ncbi:hypothetical protein K438DRAFT_1996572 [Mycena galopus ATCC 62051]|nr:hypothetical protein K438DRAFT_1996572 [Mycena galopus ATCC 62051]
MEVKGKEETPLLPPWCVGVVARDTSVCLQLRRAELWRIRAALYSPTPQRRASDRTVLHGMQGPLAETEERTRTAESARLILSPSFVLILTHHALTHIPDTTSRTRGTYQPTTTTLERRQEGACRQAAAPAVSASTVVIVLPVSIHPKAKKRRVVVS